MIKCVSKISFICVAKNSLLLKNKHEKLVLSQVEGQSEIKFIERMSKDVGFDLPAAKKG